MKLKTRLYVTIITAVTFPGIRELLVWITCRIFNPDFGPFYRLYINFVGAFLIAALVGDLIFHAWAQYKYWGTYGRYQNNQIKYKFNKKD